MSVNGKTATTQGLANALKEQKPAQTGVDPYKRAQGFLKAMLPAIKEALPRSSALSPDRLTRLCMTTLRTNPKLLECTLESLLGAMLQSAQLGLDPSVGNCYFIPFKGQVSFQIGYKGLIDLACRSGNVQTVVAGEVRQGDDFHYEFGRNETLKHIPAPHSERGEVEYYYAYAMMKDGGFAFQVMHLSEIEKIRDEHSISYKYDKNNSIWAKHFQSMAFKSVIKRLMKYIPLAAETQVAINSDESVRKDITAEIFSVEDEEPDNVIIMDKQEEKANG
jgi:recombination protein RecT